MIMRLRKIYSDNESTHYDYSTGACQPTYARKAFLVCLAAVIAFCLGRDINEFVGVILTVQAILIGFSFSVMFFLVEERQITPPASETREEKLRRNQLETLCKEIFWNISYFNVVSLISMAAAMLLMIPSPIGFIPVHRLPETISIDAYSSAISYAMVIAFFFGKFAFSVLLIDSAYTFARLVGRVNFLFEKRIGANA